MAIKRTRIALCLVCCLAAGGGAVLATTARLPDGSQFRAEELARRQGKVLLKTSTAEGHGLLWVNEADLTLITPDPPSFDDDLALATAWLDEDQLDRAEAKLLELVKRDPSRNDARRGLARLYRKKWHFKAALHLLENAINEGGENDIGLLRDAAEIAVLSGARSADKFIRRLRAAAKGDTAIKKHAEALREQSKGGQPVAFTDDARPAFSLQELVERRSAYDRNTGDCWLAARVAAEIANSFASRDAVMVERAQAFCNLPPATITWYQQGGDEGFLRQAARKVNVTVVVKGERWTALFDWNKRMELFGGVYLAQKHFPKADIELWVVETDPRDPEKRRTKDLAKATFVAGKGLEDELFTLDHRDPLFDSRVRMEEIDRQRREGMMKKR